MNVLLSLIIFAYYIVAIVQAFLAYGTAYRKTKANGDDGSSLFGWLILYRLAAVIPYLGIYLWKESKKSSFR